MQLIKDFNDIPRFVSFLNQDNQQKLLSEINSLLVRFMDEQSKGNSSAKTESPQNINNVSKSMPLQPIENKPNAINNEAAAGLNALKNNFASKGNMPPPPPLQTGNLPLTRSITAGALNFKANVNNTARLQNKKPVMSLVDSWEYIIPELTDTGKDILKNPNIKSDLYKLLKQIDGQLTLKQVFMLLNENTGIWAKFLNNIYPLYRERELNLKKQRSFPTDVEISCKIGELLISQGLITEDNLEIALETQKNPVESVVESNNWMDKAKSVINNETSGNQKKKIGEVLVDLKFINKEDLDNALTLQKWIKNILLHG